MNFTLTVKKEIIRKKYNSVPEKKAFLSGYLRLAAKIDNRSDFAIAVQSDEFAHCIYELVSSVYGADMQPDGMETDNFGNALYWFVLHGDTAKNILFDLEILREVNGTCVYDPVPAKESAFITDEKTAAAYIAGMFLAAGSCTVPLQTKAGEEEKKTSFHFEIAFYDELLADDVAAWMADESVGPGLDVHKTTRKNSVLLYLKSVTKIKNILFFIGAKKAAEALGRQGKLREKNNRDNRLRNIQKGNESKIAGASAAQIAAIRELQETAVLDTLEEGLQQAARIRLEYPEASLAFLAEKMNMTKSGFSHRMKRLEELASRTKR